MGENSQVATVCKISQMRINSLFFLDFLFYPELLRPAKFFREREAVVNYRYVQHCYESAKCEVQ